MSESRRPSRFFTSADTPAASKDGGAEEGTAPSHHAAGPSMPPAQAESIDILIVDDDPRNLTVLESVLDDPRYRMIRAESADQALIALIAGDFALLILDIRMPDMNGIELAHLIKGRKKTAQVPIIFLTAYYTEDQHILEGYGTGAVDYLHKPVNPAILRSKVAVFVELHIKSRELLSEVTERRRAEDRLRELNETLEQRVTEGVDALMKTSAALNDAGERYRSLFDGSLDAIFSLGADGRFEVANPATLRLTGRTLAELSTIRFQDLCAPEQRALTEDALLAARRGEHVRLDTQVITATGERRDLFMSGAPLRASGEVVAVSCIGRDVTEHKRAEMTLLRSEARYRRLFEAAKDGILILDDGTGQIRDANPVMSELLGCAPGELLGKALWEIGLFGNRSANEAALLELRAQGYLRFEPAPLSSKNGGRIDVEVVASVYREGQDSVVQCNIRDMTERRRLEKLLREHAAALEDLHRRKDEFLAMLSHELRNPLAPITHAAQLLISHQHNDALQHQAHTIIERQARHMTKLVDDLLDVARIATGEILIQREPLAADAVVEHAVETVGPLLDQRRHELAVSLSPEPIWLYADPARMEQILVNLLTNAAKYTAEGGKIGVSVQREGDVCALRVRDTGLGITPEFLPYVFDKFTQADRTLDRAQGGLGIGLALVKRLVEMHGGRIEAHSTLGQGSEFVVRLPVMAAENAPPPSLRTPPTQPSGQPRRVLIVDDNEDAATMLGMRLKAAGHTLRMVHDGLDALDAAREFKPDVVLLDIGLPGMDGYEVARRLRHQPLFDRVVLVATTGYGQDSDRRLSEQAGFDHHLVKPADFGLLKQILDRVERSPTASPGAPPDG